MAKSAKEQLSEYKGKTLMAIKGQRKLIRDGVTVIEMGIGAYGGGYAAGTMDDVMGVPVDAGAALLLIGGGAAMRQKDMLALGLGAMFGYLGRKGYEQGQEAANAIPAPQAARRAA